MIGKYNLIIKNILERNNCIYLIICIFVLFIIGKKSRITFFDFSDIIKKYLECFQKKKILMKFIVFILPAILAYIAVAENQINDDTINIITIIISILTAMFFTLIEVLIDLRDKFQSKGGIDVSKYNTIKSLISETFYIVMYEIMNSIFVLLFCFMTIFSNKFGKIDSFIIYYFSVTLILNLFIVLNRMFALIDNILH